MLVCVGGGRGALTGEGGLGGDGHKMLTIFLASAGKGKNLFGHKLIILTKFDTFDEILEKRRNSQKRFGLTWGGYPPSPSPKNQFLGPASGPM